MKRFPIRSTRLLVAAALAVCTTTAMGAAQDPQADPYMKRYDADGDGYVSLAEYRKAGGSERAFTETDANRDGRLDSTEIYTAAAYDDRLKVADVTKDTWVTAKVKAALIRDKAVRGRDVSVETHQGTVQLSGFVRSPDEKQRAAQVASNIDGVREVVNSLIVKS